MLACVDRSKRVAAARTVVLLLAPSPTQGAWMAAMGGEGGVRALVRLPMLADFAAPIGAHRPVTRVDPSPSWRPALLRQRRTIERVAPVLPLWTLPATEAPELFE